jgi:pSer/pThr/pTyr-binding forkhead associated (FHA) protein
MLGQGAITVGRRPNCDLVLTDPAASREHARIIVGDQSAAVEDLGSHNGVFVNGRRIRGIQRLSPGDKIDIGQEQIEVIGFEEPNHNLTPSYDDQEATMIGRRASGGPLDEDGDPAPTIVTDPKRPR